jgi:hypothetical protein
MARKSGDERSGQERRAAPRASSEGSSDDAPSHGEWQRRNTGPNSGAEGQGLNKGLENTWGGEQFRAERREEQGRRQANSGPRGRRKSDESLRQEIREILNADPEVEATDIEVDVEGGAVTLRGTVVDSDARLLAEELVESLVGVREVHNRLRVEREED